MSVERKQSLFIIAYPGKETADEVYHTLRALEKQDKIDIKTAATLYRAEDGKLRLKHRRRLTVWKGAFGVGAIGLILAGTGAGFLAGAVVGALIGSSRSRQRHEVKEFLEDKIGRTIQPSLFWLPTPTGMQSKTKSIISAASNWPLN